MDKKAVRSGCYVTVWDENSVADALKLGSSIRSRGLVVDMDVEGGKLGRQMKIADERGSRIVTVQGPDEKVAGEVTIKDMETGTQQKVSENEVVARIQAILS